MCGIIGSFSFKGLNEGRQAAVQEALNTLQHRGPDHTGFFSDPHIFLGHQRLSILDLSPQSNQPFFSSCNRYVAVFNGEIYNYRALAEKHGLALRTGSDTEVLVELYRRLGPQTVLETEGMFAFAIYDRAQHSLFAARDRMGIKPFFYAFNENGFHFASELKAFRHLCPQETARVYPPAIGQFLHLGFIPAPHTIFKGINKLLPGHTLNVGESAPVMGCYYQPAATAPAGRPPAPGLIAQTVEASVQAQLVADVPVGCFLSGGIDSSLVTAVAQKHYPGKIQTFTIGFRQKEKNEAVYAADIARYLGTEHTEHFFTEQDALDITEAAIDRYDEPFADSSAIPTYLLSKITAQKVKVALSGDGGDELFLGYGAYRWAQRLSKPHLHYGRSVIGPLLRYGGQRNQRASWMFDYARKSLLAPHIFSQEQYLFSEKELNRWAGRPFLPQHHWHDSMTHAGLHAVEKQQQFDLRYYLPDDLLTKVDRASMAHSLEVRVPLLDEKMVALAQHIHHSHKMPAGKLKFLLRQTLEQYIPRQYFDRPKQGFSVPLAHWLRTDLKYMTDRFLDHRTVEQYGLIDPAYVARIKKRFGNGENIWYNKIWVLALLHRWMIRSGF